jgi:hypothetical protein
VSPLENKIVRGKEERKRKKKKKGKHTHTLQLPKHTH